MLQETADELFRREAAQLGLPGIRLAISECHLIIFHLDQAPVAERHPEHVGRQVLEGRPPVPDRLAVHHLLLLPDFRRDLRENRRLCHGLPEPPSEYSRERHDWQQEPLCVRLGLDPACQRRNGDGLQNIGVHKRSLDRACRRRV